MRIVTKLVKGTLIALGVVYLPLAIEDAKRGVKFAKEHRDLEPREYFAKVKTEFID